MAKSIITQDGDIVNYGNLVAIYVEDDLDDDENVLGYELLGLTGGGKDSGCGFWEQSRGLGRDRGAGQAVSGDLRFDGKSPCHRFRR